MFRIGRKAAVIALTAVIGTGLLGGAALAAFAPAPEYALSVDGSDGNLTIAETPKGGQVKNVLDALVSKGVITQAQEDAIIGALKDARGDRDAVKRILTGLFQESATYLGIAPKDLHARLAGTSLGAIANATPGKSRDGLVTDLTNTANAAIDKAIADGRITQEQADKAKAALPDRIAQFVDHTWPATQPKPDVRAFIGDVMKDARDYLGLPQKDIATQLRSGKSLGDIANATAGKSRDGLVAAIMSDANAKIDKAQQDGRLTVAQAAQLKTTVASAVAKIVDHTGNAPKARN